MYRLLKPKNIHRALIGLILLAPIVYLFGTQISALAGAHGQEILATDTPVVIGETERVENQVLHTADGVYHVWGDTDFSVVDNTWYLPAGSYSMSTTYYDLPRSSYTWVVGHKYALYGQNSLSDFPCLNLVYSNPYGEYTPTRRPARIFTPTSSGYFILRFVPLSTSFTLSETWSCWINVVDLTKLYGVGNEPTTIDAYFADYPLLNRPYDVEGKRVVTPIYGDGNYAQDLQNQFFGKNNILEQWGSDALADNRHGFAPVGELFKYVDDNILHLSDNQIGKMGYGYMYYVVHVLIFDVVAMAFVFIVTIPQKVLNMINDKTGGDL